MVIDGFRTTGDPKLMKVGVQKALPSNGLDGLGSRKDGDTVADGQLQVLQFHVRDVREIQRFDPDGGVQRWRRRRI